MWTPNLVTVLKKKHERRSKYIFIYFFKKRFIYMIIIVRRKRAAKQASGDAAGRGCAKWASAVKGLSLTVNTVTITT